MAIKIQKLVDSVLEIAALPKTTVRAEGTLQVFLLSTERKSTFSLCPDPNAVSMSKPMLQCHPFEGSTIFLQ